MVRLENIRGAKVQGEEIVTPGALPIEQLFEGKQYIWGPGDAMDLPDHVANWMLRKLNDVDRNEGMSKKPGAKPGLDRSPWVRAVPVPEGAKMDSVQGVVRANVKAKRPEQAQAAK
jgi:hypothetical protein